MPAMPTTGLCAHAETLTVRMMTPAKSMLIFFMIFSPQDDCPPPKMAPGHVTIAQQRAADAPPVRPVQVINYLRNRMIGLLYSAGRPDRRVSIR